MVNPKPTCMVEPAAKKFALAEARHSQSARRRHSWVQLPVEQRCDDAEHHGERSQHLHCDRDRQQGLHD